MSLVLFPATYDGTSLVQVTSSVPRVVIGLVGGLDDSPEVRGDDTTIPGAAGKVPRDRVWDHRTIELEGFIAGVGATHAAQAADIRSLLETLRTLFATTRSPATLSIELEDGGSATISARPLNMLCPASVDTVRATVNIQLLAVEADWDVTLGGS